MFLLNITDVDADVALLLSCNLLSVINSFFSLTEMVVNCPIDAEFAFADFEFAETLVTKWNLVCDQKNKVPSHAYILGGQSKKWKRFKTFAIAIKLFKMLFFFLQSRIIVQNGIFAWEQV